MAIEVELPDGTVVEFPDGTDRATMERALAQYAQQQPARAPARQADQAAQADDAPIDPTEGMSGWEKFGAGVGKALVDTGYGLRQVLTEGAGVQQTLFGNVADALGADALAGFYRRNADQMIEEARRLRAVADDRAALDAPLMRTGAGRAGDIAGQVVLAALPVAGPATRVTAGAGRLARVAASAADAATFAATQPVGTEGSRAQAMAEGAAWGGAGRVLSDGVARATKGLSDKLSPAVLDAYEKARAAGIPVHFSQLVDSKAAKTLASAASYLPFSGAGKAARKQQEAFNRAVSRSFGEDAATLGDDVIGAARERLGRVFEEVYGRNSVRLDDAALEKLAEIEKLASRNLPANEAAVIRNQIEDILASSADGTLPGRLYQSFRTDRLMPLESGARTFQSGLVRQIRKALDDAAARSLSPEDAKALAMANRQWRNLKTADKALSQVEGAKGNVRPGALWPIVNQKRGATPEMRELAKVGRLLNDPIPDSGTAARMLTYGALGGGGAALGATDNQALQQIGAALLLGSTAGRALNSKAAANYLARGTGLPGKVVRKIAKGAPYLLPAMARATNALELEISGGRVGPWTPEDEAELRRLRAEAARLRAEVEGR